MKRLKNYLTEEECKSIIDSCKNKPRKQNRYEITEFALPTSVSKKLQKTLAPNRVSCAIQCYEPGDSFSPHRDYIWVTDDGKQNYARDREQSMSILLNDSFEGGDLMVEYEKAPMNKGDATLFTAKDLHWVTGVWEGTRYVLSAWGMRSYKFEKIE
tara:strand:- start:1105 stop:1572 length:468 start_codon:yes stop_codon:yes gene_type:complete